MKTRKKVSQVEKKLKALFMKRTNVNIDQIPSLKDENFFGYRINMPAREAVLLLLDIEREFGVYIPNEFILSKRFTTFQNLLDYLNGVK